MKSEIEDLKILEKTSENECPDVNEKLSPNRDEAIGGSKRLSAPPGFENLTTTLTKDSISNNSSQDIVTQDNSSMKHSSVDNLSTTNSPQSDSIPEKSSMKQLSVDKLSSKKGSYVDTLSMKNYLQTDSTIECVSLKSLNDAKQNPNGSSQNLEAEKVTCKSAEYTEIKEPRQTVFIDAPAPKINVWQKKSENSTAQLQSSDQENSSKEENMEKDTVQPPLPASEAKVIY